MRFPSTLVVAVAAAVGLAAVAWSQEDPNAGVPKKWTWKEIATPGAGHKLLDAMVGEWDTTTAMSGMPSTKGTAKYEWILGGRYIEGRGNSTLMGMPYESRSLWGYDNYKKAYVLTSIDTWGTHMIHGDGKAERDGKAIHFYGRMDEWMDGTLKNNRYTLRFDGPDRMLFEVHDLDIGEKNTMVFTIEYRRRK